MAGGAINVYVRALRPLAAPGIAGADVVPLPDRTAPEAGPGGGPRRRPQARRRGAGDGALADFRGVAPAVQSFAAGRRR